MPEQDRRFTKFAGGYGDFVRPKTPMDTVRNFLFGAAPDKATEFIDSVCLVNPKPCGGINAAKIPTNGRHLPKRPLQIRLPERISDLEPLPAEALPEVRRALTAWAAIRSAGAVEDFGRSVRLNHAEIVNSYVVILDLLREKRSAREAVRQRRPDEPPVPKSPGGEDDRSSWPETVYPAPYGQACEVVAEIPDTRTIEPCGACQGETGWTCLGCNGEKKTVCAECMGAGAIDCPDCGTRGSSCPTCGGEGRIACYKCNCMGEVPCRKCGGEGVVKCLECRGHGHLIRCRQVVAEYKPEKKRFHHYNNDDEGGPSEAWFGMETGRLKWKVMERILAGAVSANQADRIDPKDLPESMADRIRWELGRISDEADFDERIFLTGYTIYKYPIIKLKMTYDDLLFPAAVDAHTGEVLFEKDPLVHLAEKVRRSMTPLDRRNGPSAADFLRRYGDLKLLAAVLPGFDPEDEPMTDFVQIMAHMAYRVAASCPNQGRVADAHLALYFSLRPDLNRKNERKVYFERFRNGMNILDRSSFMSQKSEPLWKPGDVKACFRVLDRYMQNFPEICSFLSAPLEERRRWHWKTRFF